MAALLESQKLPDNIFKSLIESSTPITFVTKKGSKGSKNEIIVHNPRMFDRFAKDGEIGLSESYMDGDWETSDLEYVVTVFLNCQGELLKNLKKKSLSFVWAGIKAHIAGIRNNTVESSRRNIAHHYDVGNDLYSRMLGQHMQYTCAYYHKPDMTLDDAQLAKMELVAKKLDLKTGMTVLDIGCGFGAMAYHLATKYNVTVRGVTLSNEQKKHADKHYGNWEHYKIEVKDYRHVKGKFDRIYSVGMLEHAGRRNYKEYFTKVFNLLKPDGLMLIHTIATSQREWNRHTFVAKYIFPEFELPNLNSLTGTFSDCWHIEDLQNFGLSYAKTLRAWNDNLGDWKGLDKYTPTFRRMWTLYLLGCAATFQTRDNSLWQIVYTKKNNKRVDDCHHIRV
jgi:cyclopropane-fatty-acyl-phospholipid synthase